MAATKEAGDDAGEAADALREGNSSLVYHFGRCICRVWTDLQFELKVYGTQHLPRTGGVLIVSNHQSYLDPVLLATKFPRPFSFMAKSELFENPRFAWLIRKLNAYPVRQGDGDIGALKETIRRLQAGHALTVFPEGTRTDNGELLPLEPGVGLIVRRAGVPVVPAVIFGSFQAWPRDRKMWREHPVHVMFGPVMDLKGLKAAAIVERIGMTMRTMFEELRERAHG